MSRSWLTPYFPQPSSRRLSKASLFLFWIFFFFLTYLDQLFSRALVYQDVFPLNAFWNEQLLPRREHMEEKCLTVIFSFPKINDRTEAEIFEVCHLINVCFLFWIMSFQSHYILVSLLNISEKCTHIKTLTSYCTKLLKNGSCKCCVRMCLLCSDDVNKQESAALSRKIKTQF